MNFSKYVPGGVGNYFKQYFPMGDENGSGPSSEFEKFMDYEKYIHKYNSSGSSDKADYQKYMDFKNFIPGNFSGNIPQVKNWSNNTERQDAIKDFITTFAGSNAASMPDAKTLAKYAKEEEAEEAKDAANGTTAVSESPKSDSELPESPKTDSADESNPPPADGTCTKAVTFWHLARGCDSTPCEDRSNEAECTADRVMNGKPCCKWEPTEANGILALSTRGQSRTASHTWIFRAAVVPAAGLVVLLGMGMFRSRAPKEDEDLSGCYHLSA